MKHRISLGQYMVVMVIACLLLALVGLFCSGAVFADDGSGESSSNLTALWVALLVILPVLGSIYLDILKPMLIAVWAEKEDTFRWKLRGSILAIFGYAIWDTLKAAYKQGLFGAIISVLIAIVKSKLGIPAAVKMAGKAFKK